MNVLKREPVLLGAAVAATADFVIYVVDLSSEATNLAHLLVLAWIAWLVRLVSTPTVKVDETTATAVAAKEAEVHAFLAGAQTPPTP